MIAARKKSVAESFVPVVVVGPDAAERTRGIQQLSALVDQPVEGITEQEFDKRLGRKRDAAPFGVMALIVPVETDLDEWLTAQLQRVRASDPALPVVLLGTGLDGRETAAALRLGVDDVVFPTEPDQHVRERIGGRLNGWIQRRASRAAGSLFGDAAGVPRMIGSAPSMREVARLVERVATSDATVLILGESGTGKELVARALHVFSPRCKGPFVAINCAAIPDTLLENELFGHEKGSYTGASSTAIGKVEAAETGTLFLDEIGDMPIQLQSKILRLLQDHTFDRIGGTKTRKADIRVVAATNRDLKLEVAAGSFREDLYYRLSVVPIQLPALRDRPEDTPVIVHSIVERLAERLSRPALRVSTEAMERLVAYRWPGNVRELENELERAAVLAGGDEIRASDLELRARVEDADRAALARWVPLDLPLDEALERAREAARRFRVSVALEQANGDREQAAAALGITVDELSHILEV